MSGSSAGPWAPKALAAAIFTGIVGALIMTGLPGWFPRPWRHEPGVPDGVRGFVGGCEPFPVYAQNRFTPLGAAFRADPSPTGRKVGGAAGNELVPVNGWVRSRAAYPANSAPWNSDVWFHLADNSGWVSFAGVRADPTVPDETGGFSADGGRPVPVTDDCSGAIR